MMFSRRSNKKGIMGVSTLIIFITAILVAAVAASVIVRTVGILQERAFTVGTDVRDRLVTVLDMISISSHNNVTQEHVYGISMMVRTRAGSFAYDLSTAGMVFTSDAGSFTARLQHTENEDLDFDIPSVDNSTTTDIVDMDKDRLPEEVRLDTRQGDDMLEFYFTREETYAYADLAANVSDAAAGDPVNISVNDTPIVSDSGRWMGFVHAVGATEDPQSLSSPEVNMTVTRYPRRDYCSFETLMPETAFCYETQLGQGNPAISRGEVYRLYYRLTPENYLEPDEDFEVQFIPESGDVSSERARVPSALVRDSGQIWPTAMQQ